MVKDLYPGITINKEGSRSMYEPAVDWKPDWSLEIKTFVWYQCPIKLSHLFVWLTFIQEDTLEQLRALLKDPLLKGLTQKWQGQDLNSQPSDLTT